MSVGMMCPSEVRAHSGVRNAPAWRLTRKKSLPDGRSSNDAGKCSRDRNVAKKWTSRAEATHPETACTLICFLLVTDLDTAFGCHLGRVRGPADPRTACHTWFISGQFPDEPRRSSRLCGHSIMTGGRGKTCGPG